MVMSPGGKKIFVSTGCSSSDVLVVPLLKELMRRGLVSELSAMGGEPLREMGADLVYDSTPLASIGVAQSVSSFLRRGFGLMRALRKLNQSFRADPPDLVILVDNAGINFRVLSIAHRHRVPVLYYIPPELWSVLSLELGIVRRSRPKLATIFESQTQEYLAKGLDAEWIGHPMLDLLREFPKAPREVGDRPIIGLFPGSRAQEVRLLLEPMRKGAERILDREPQAKFILCAANPMTRKMIEDDLPHWRVPVDVRYRQSHEVLSQCHLALACSGTVTLEAALLGVPMVAMYRLSVGVDFLLQRLVLPLSKYRFFSLPNVLLGEPLVKELGNRDVHADRIAQESLTLLRDPGRRRTVLDGLAKIPNLLGNEGAFRRAADLSEELLTGRSPHRHEMVPAETDLTAA